MKKLFVLSLLLLFGITIFAKNDVEVTLEKTKKTEYKKGPKSKHFSHLYYGVNFPIPPENEGAELLYFKSYGMDFGHKEKFMLSNYYALGFNLSYGFMLHRFDQNENKITPDDIKYDKQWLISHEFNLGFYNRFNFDGIE